MEDDTTEGVFYLMGMCIAVVECRSDTSIPIYLVGTKKMRFTDEDRTVLAVDDHLRLAGIPLQAHECEVNGSNAPRVVHRPLPDHAGQGQRHRQRSERLVRGTLKMAEVTVAAGLPQPEIEDAGGCVTVRFRHPVATVHLYVGEHVAIAGESSTRVRKLSERQRNILDLPGQADRPLALREIHARLPDSVSVRQVKRVLGRLRELGLATSTGHGVAARWKPGLEQWPRQDRSIGVP